MFPYISADAFDTSVMLEPKWASIGLSASATKCNSQTHPPSCGTLVATRRGHSHSCPDDVFYPETVDMRTDSQTTGKPELSAYHTDMPYRNHLKFLVKDHIRGPETTLPTPQHFRLAQGELNRL